MNKKPNILILIMSADQEHFRSQIEDCKNTWLSVLKDEKYINIINKYINKIDWLYYDTNINNKYNLNRSKDNNLYLDINTYDKIIQDKDDEHHLYNILEDDCWTWQKTYDVLDYIANNKEYSDYDYVIRTNTSSYINIMLLSYILYKEYNDKNINSDMMCYGTELISMFSTYIPNQNDVYIRGNCLILSNYIINNVILKYGQMYNSSSYNGDKNKVCDDVVIGNILNVYFNDFKKYSFDYLKHYTGLPQCWYKCVTESYKTYHKWSINDYADKFIINDGKVDDDVLAMFSGAINIQVKNYLDRSLEHGYYIELHDNMKKYVYCNYCNKNALNTIYNKVKNEYSNNPSVFVQGNFPYLQLNDIKKLLMNKEHLKIFTMECFSKLPIDHPWYCYFKKLINKV